MIRFTKITLHCINITKQIISFEENQNIVLKYDNSFTILDFLQTNTCPDKQKCLFQKFVIFFILIFLISGKA